MILPGRSLAQDEDNRIGDCVQNPWEEPFDNFIASQLLGARCPRNLLFGSGAERPDSATVCR